MKLRILWCAALGLALAAPASARTYFGFQIGISNAPPAPVVVFHDEPEFVPVPDTHVYVVESEFDYDVFRYGNRYYLCDNGYWYRAPSSRGPFRVVDVRYVPRPIFYVPEKHWKHYWRQHGDVMVVKEKPEHGHGRGHGRGHHKDFD